jgi:hypothetical protein
MKGLDAARIRLKDPNSACGEEQAVAATATDVPYVAEM